MRYKNPTRRGMVAALTAPAAVLGTLAAALVPTTAHAHAEAPLKARLAAMPVEAAVLPAPVAAAVLPAATRPATHTVVRGDSVWAIATRHSLKPADVLAWNGLTASSTIYPGQTLRLSASGGAAPAPAPAAKPSTPSTTGASSATHTVVRGDTVYAIAKKHGTTVSAVLSANRIGSSAIIYPGQKLTIPRGGATASAPVATAPATPAPAPAPKPSVPSASPEASTGSHTVVRGDTVYAIAKKYGTTVSAVLTANRIGSSAIIYPGQKLTIPGAATPAPASSGSSSSAPLAQKSAVLNAPQIENTKMIISIGRSLGVSDRGIAIALATAMVESGIRNLDYGDRDSLGLFQQRPSTGWGTAAQIRDRNYSIRAFYGGASNPNRGKTRGLLDISGWQSMSFTRAAQAVQISAFPDRYGQWETAAYQWLALHG